MARLRVCAINHVDSTLSLTATPPELASMPVGSLKTTSRDRAFRSVALTTQVIQGHWNGDGKKASFAAMFRHNCHGGQWRVQLYSDIGFTTQVYDSGAVDILTLVPLGSFEWGVDPLMLLANDAYATDAPAFMYFPAISYAAFKITLTVSGASGPYWQIGRLWLGNYFETSYNPDYDQSLMLQTTGAQGRTDGGSIRSRAGATFKQVDLNLAWVPDSERPIWTDLVRSVDLRQDIFFSLYPQLGGRDERDFTLAAKLAASPAQKKWAYNLNSLPLSLVEI